MDMLHRQHLTNTIWLTKHRDLLECMILEAKTHIHLDLLNRILMIWDRHRQCINNQWGQVIIKWVCLHLQWACMVDNLLLQDLVLLIMAINEHDLHHIDNYHKLLMHRVQWKEFLNQQLNKRSVLLVAFHTVVLLKKWENTSLSTVK